MGDAFYTEQGQIKDASQAHELANLVVDKGTRVAEAREMELKRQAETGLTDAEKRNLLVLEALSRTFPHAFEPDDDGTLIRVGQITGEKYLISREVAHPDHDMNYRRLVVTRLGVAVVAGDGGSIFPITQRELSEVDFSHVVKEANSEANRLVREPKITVNFKTGESNVYQVQSQSTYTESESAWIKLLLQGMEKEG
ncbi:MAG: hypothetical protein AAB768_03725, partial [Patescibacteria group bacterium]